MELSRQRGVLAVCVCVPHVCCVRVPARLGLPHVLPLSLDPKWAFSVSRLKIISHITCPPQQEGRIFPSACTIFLVRYHPAFRGSVGHEVRCFFFCWPVRSRAQVWAQPRQAARKRTDMGDDMGDDIFERPCEGCGWLWARAPGALLSSHGLSTLESRRRTWEVRPCLSSSFSSFTPLSSPASACSASVHAAMHLPQRCLQGWMLGWDCCCASAKPSRLLLCHGCCQPASFAPPHGVLGRSLASTTRRPGPSCRCCPPPTCETPQAEPRGCSRCGVCRCALPPTATQATAIPFRVFCFLQIP